MRGDLHAIKGTVYHVLSWQIAELITFGFRLAFERGLTDLKGLVEADSLCVRSDDGKSLFWDVEIELLNSIEEEGIRWLMKAVNQLLDFLEVYRIANGLELEEIHFDEGILDEADFLYTSISYIPKQDMSYAELLRDLFDIEFWNMSYRLYLCASTFNKQRLDIFVEDMGMLYLDEVDHIEERLVIAKDRNGGLLFDLMADMNDLVQGWRSSL